ncbi:hypothetical protein ACVWYG_002572 [Pedobacter sp. UYEF25]
MTTYELTSLKTQGDFSLEFDAGGCLITCKMAFKQSLKSETLHNLLFSNIPFKEADLPQLNKLGFTITKAVPTNHKIALFCRLYEKYKEIKYKVSPSDTGKIKSIKIDEALLKVYFESETFIFKSKQSIANLAKYYNELRAEIAAGGKGKYPNNYSAEFIKKLPMDQWGGYWEHLRSLGLSPVKDRTGNTTDWIPSPNPQRGLK